MTQGTSFVLGAALAALTLGVTGDVPQMREMPLSAGHIVMAADDDAPQGAPTEDNSAESAKMGKDEGTHSGPDQGSTPENDTSKIDQPARRNPTTGGADAPEGSGQ